LPLHSLRDGTSHASNVLIHCAFSALVNPAAVWRTCGVLVRKLAFKYRGCSVKKAALALALVVAALSLGGCFVGKGKAPAPIVTKG